MQDLTPLAPFTNVAMQDLTPLARALWCEPRFPLKAGFRTGPRGLVQPTRIGYSTGFVNSGFGWVERIKICSYRLNLLQPILDIGIQIDIFVASLQRKPDSLIQLDIDYVASTT